MGRRVRRAQESPSPSIIPYESSRVHLLGARRLALFTTRGAISLGDLGSGEWVSAPVSDFIEVEKRDSYELPAAVHGERGLVCVRGRSGARLVSVANALGPESPFSLGDQLSTLCSAVAPAMDGSDGFWAWVEDQTIVRIDRDGHILGTTSSTASVGLARIRSWTATGTTAIAQTQAGSVFTVQSGRPPEHVLGPGPRIERAVTAAFIAGSEAYLLSMGDCRKVATDGGIEACSILKEVAGEPMAALAVSEGVAVAVPGSVFILTLEGDVVERWPLPGDFVVKQLLEERPGRLLATGRGRAHAITADAVEELQVHDDPLGAVVDPVVPSARTLEVMAKASGVIWAGGEVQNLARFRRAGDALIGERIDLKHTSITNPLEGPEVGALLAFCPDSVAIGSKGLIAELSRRTGDVYRIRGVEDRPIVLRSSDHEPPEPPVNILQLPKRLFTTPGGLVIQSPTHIQALGSSHVYRFGGLFSAGVQRPDGSFVLGTDNGWILQGALRQ